MNICVIGGSGFVGTKLISSLLGENLVINIDKAKSILHPQISYLGDVCQEETFSGKFSGQDVVILLAAEHRDDVTPSSLYYDVNVKGMKNVLKGMDSHGVKNIIFTSTVAIYGMNRDDPPRENSKAEPFNDYGKSKWEAEQVLKKWVLNKDGRNALIVRPTVILGEGNRGNVYNLLKQIYRGRFLMIGEGTNRKSMAYIENVVAFIKYKLASKFSGIEIFNYVDKPDFDMNALVSEVFRFKGMPAPKLRLPYLIGLVGGYCFDILAKILGKKSLISSIRVKKFCSSTEINGDKVIHSGFRQPISLKKGLQRTLENEFKG